MELTTAGWLLLALASALVGLAKGGLAMVGMLAVPILSLAMSPVQAAGVLLPVYVVSDIFGLIAYRRHWDRRVLATLLPGSIAGIALGWATASLVDDAAVGGIVGVIGASFAALTLLRPPAPDAAPGRPGWTRGTGWGPVSYTHLTLPTILLV